MVSATADAALLVLQQLRWLIPEWEDGRCLQQPRHHTVTFRSLWNEVLEMFVFFYLMIWVCCYLGNALLLSTAAFALSNFIKDGVIQQLENNAALHGFRTSCGPVCRCSVHSNHSVFQYLNISRIQLYFFVPAHLKFLSSSVCLSISLRLSDMSLFLSQVLTRTIPFSSSFAHAHTHHIHAQHTHVGLVCILLLGFQAV